MFGPSILDPCVLIVNIWSLWSGICSSRACSKGGLTWMLVWDWEILLMWSTILIIQANQCKRTDKYETKGHYIVLFSMDSFSMIGRGTSDIFSAWFLTCYVQFTASCLPFVFVDPGHFVVLSSGWRTHPANLVSNATERTDPLKFLWFLLEANSHRRWFEARWLRTWKLS